MSAAHTPGPWIIDPRHYWDKGIGIRQDADGWHRLYCEVDRDDCDRDTAEANARLIASAPALLEALEEARTVLSITRTNIMCEINRCADPRDSRWEGVPEILKERIAKIDAAISLAKGESK